MAKSSAGFTLIELLIAISIIGVLASSLVMALNPVEQFKKGRDVQRKNDLEQVRNALDIYYSDNSHYPGQIDNEIEGKNWDTEWYPYMAKLPKDPISDQDYYYDVPEDGSFFRLYARLERCNSDNQLIVGSDCLSLYNYSVTSTNVSPIAFGGLILAPSVFPTAIPAHAIVPTRALAFAPSLAPSLSPLPTSTPTPTIAIGNSYSQLRAQGNMLVNILGEIVTLRGATLIRWPFTMKDMHLDHAVADAFTRSKALGGWGANAFTLWVTTQEVDNGKYWPYSDEMVRIAVKNKAYVIFAWFAQKGSDSHPLTINNPGIAAMRTLAKRYANNPAVIYITQSEPTTTSWSLLKEWQEKTIDAIRAESPNALICYSGTNWSQNFTGVLIDPIDRPNLCVQLHLYRHGLTTLNSLLKERKMPELKARFPVVIGEFGKNEWPTDLIRYSDIRSISWQAWNLADIAVPVLLNTMNANDPNDFGKEIKGQL